MLALLWRLERLALSSMPESRKLLRRYRKALCDPWVVAQLEKAAKPLSPDTIVNVMVELWQRDTRQ